MGRPRHTDKHVEKAISYAESLGWSTELSHGHIWGKLYCPERSRDGCIVFVYSTPRNREAHARQLRREIDLCEHCGSEESEG
jgi:hypothetical protein